MAVNEPFRCCPITKTLSDLNLYSRIKSKFARDCVRGNRKTYTVNTEWAEENNGIKAHPGEVARWAIREKNANTYQKGEYTSLL